MHINKSLKNRSKLYIRRLVIFLRRLGLDLIKISNSRYIFRYFRDKRKWRKLGGSIHKNHIVLGDYRDSAGVSKGHYFHQDLLVAKYIFEHGPNNHIDVGSRVDGFVAHVASFRKIQVLDIRPMEQSPHENIEFSQVDLANLPPSIKADSVSCLHAIEHFGLGRYTDQIDVNGHVKGITNLINMVETGGRLYLSFPIGISDQVHFNAHRVFRPDTILKLAYVHSHLELIKFDYVDDKGDLHKNQSIADANGCIFGCGIYTFRKLDN